MNNIHGAYIVSFSFSEVGDVATGVLVVGKQNKGDIDIINAFQGKEALDLYQKLTIKKEVKTDEHN